MTDGDASAPSAAAPYQRWLLPLLVLSLALNLIVGGAAAVRLLAPDRIEGLTGARFSPLVPRSFITDLPEARGEELAAILKRNRGEFRSGYAAMRDAAVKFATALEKEPYNEAEVIAAVDAYGGTGTGLIQRGSAVTLELVRKLTPEERALLAAKVRERASSPRRRSKDSDRD